jgi:hypothetical protein
MRWRAGHHVNEKRAPSGALFLFRFRFYFPAFAILLLWRAAAFLWMRPLREARSRSLTAASLSSAFPADARLRAVRSADFWARLRMAAARDFRMFFFAEARFGTN